MYAYSRAFGRYDIRVAQVLLTREDMDDRRRYMNARYTVERLLEMGVVPIINENDTIAVEEIEFGDNDVLAAMVAVKIQARLLLILGTVEGLLSAEPERGSEARLIPQVNSITPEIEALAEPTPSALGRGGIRSKILSAQTAMRAGIPAILANGRDPKLYRSLEKNRVRGTYFAPAQGRRLRRRAQWILSARSGRNRRLVVDEGARRALLKGKKSLLAAGVAGVLGKFQPGDVVDIAAADQPPFACGLVNYSAQEVERIKGLRSNQIESVLGRKPYDEVIHRDNMVILENP
jgi:glutamate 5-kinase